MVRSPLSRRYLRELKSDFGKYAVIFLLLLLTISEVSGYLVAESSMHAAYDESFSRYNIEDGHFIVERKLNCGQIRRIGKAGVTLHELFSCDLPFGNGTTIRLFPARHEINLVCLMEGAFPESKDEIALDRMYAVNNGIQTGDLLSAGERHFRVTGLVAFSDYSALFSDNDDMMFDARLFGVAVITSEAFAALPDALLTARYAWKYDTPCAGEAEEAARSDAFVKTLAKEAAITDYIPRYLNQAIMFAGEDLGADRQMIQVFLFLVILIIAFVFGVTISSTIASESAVIGTLLASGYSKRELLRHYMFLPVAVTLVAALFGNILGYTLLKDVNAALYYNSYSLTTYVTRWNGEAFLLTTLLPILIMLVVDYTILRSRLSLSPLRFLRRDLRRTRKAGALPLPAALPFFTRFRIRVIHQNLSSYLLLFVGILFADLLLMFGLLIPDIMTRYQASIGENMLCNYQYILQFPVISEDSHDFLDTVSRMLHFSVGVETKNRDAEEISLYSLMSDGAGSIPAEEILLYGIGKNSRYVHVDLPEDGILVSSSYAEKYRLRPGATVTLKERYADDSYDFIVKGIYDYDGAICAFMQQDLLNECFDLGAGTFTGYFSDTEITDIRPAYISNVIDLTSLTKVSRQLTHSIGAFMRVLDVFAVLMFMILIYLLSKLIIEKNAQSVSMAKILGYRGPEIAALYLLPTSLLTALFILLSLPVSAFALEILYRYFIISKMSGWIPYHVSMEVCLKIIALGIATYAVVAVFEYRRIRRIPMNEALKNVE